MVILANVMANKIWKTDCHCSIVDWKYRDQFYLFVILYSEAIIDLTSVIIMPKIPGIMNEPFAPIPLVYAKSAPAKFGDKSRILTSKLQWYAPMKTAANIMRLSKTIRLHSVYETAKIQICYINKPKYYRSPTEANFMKVIKNTCTKHTSS